MRSSTTLALGLVALALPACARTPYVDPRVAATVEIQSTDPPPSCRYLGALRGSTTVGDLVDANDETARTAVIAGGNYVAVDFVEHPLADFIAGYSVRGRVFACPAKPQPAAPAAPAASAFAAPVAPAPAPMTPACTPNCPPAPPCAPPAPCAVAVATTPCTGGAAPCAATQACTTCAPK